MKASLGEEQKRRNIDFTVEINLQSQAKEKSFEDSASNNPESGLIPRIYVGKALLSPSLVINTYTQVYFSWLPQSRYNKCTRIL